MRAISVVFLTLYPVETASTRQRIHKNVRFFPPGIRSAIYPGITQAALRRLAARGPGRLARLAFLGEEVARKLWHLWRARHADVIVVQKGLTAMNLRGFPALLFALGRPVVFDFDDAVQLAAAQSFRSPWLRWLSDPEQVGSLFARFAAVVAGNRHLADQAARSNPRVEVIPTPMDTDWYRLRPAAAGDRVVLGWSGSTTTNHYVDRLAPVLRRVVAEFPAIELRVISNDDRGIHWELFAGVPTRFVPWCLDSLVEDLAPIDIGLMPLSDDAWSRSKCGGKILQYMASGIAPVASPVGINSELIEDGVSGFLADSDDRWVEHILRLARDPELRARIGVAARARVEAGYCNRVTAPMLAAVIRRAAEAAPVAAVKP